MRIAIYSPYLDTVGGGEKYMLSIAEVLSSKHQVEVLLDEHLASLGGNSLRSRIEFLHGLDLSQVKFIKAPIGIGSSQFKRAMFLRKYDFLFSNTDGSIFFSTAKNNILHFQVPFANSHNNLWGKIKLSSWKMAMYNSNFTKNIIEETWPIKGVVIYPPVSVELFKPLPKQKQILSVGRFAGGNQNKKHSLMIEEFKKIIDKFKIEGWSLHLVGGAGEGDQKYLESLSKLTQNSPIFLYPNLPLNDLIKLYGTSSIYWHAKGFDTDDPKDFEHFGISTVEAMASGCVPVVINKGGQPEIVDHNINGFLWKNLGELEDFTMKLIQSPKIRDDFSETAIEKSKLFSKDKFAQSILQIVKMHDE